MDRRPIADDIIRKHVLYSMGGSLIPVPIADLVATTAIQIDMVKQIANLYQIDYQESAGKTSVSAVTGNILARIGASFIKAIPGIGSLVGGISMVALTGAATYALGQVFVKHAEEGGTFKDFDADAYRQYYEDQLKEGKTKAETWKAEADQAEKNTTTDIPIEEDED